MAHYAFIDENNIVQEVITGIDETELIEGELPEIWYGNLRKMTCLRTSYNSKIRSNFAGIGYTYDPIDDAFIAPMPNCGHEELLLNPTNHRWECSNAEHVIS